MQLPLIQAMCQNPGGDSRCRWYWSGCANRAKWGLEIGGLAAIDIDNHTAFHLEAVQTRNSMIKTFLIGMQGYIRRKDTLNPYQNTWLTNAWFSKKSFADQVISSGMHLVSRLRDDADLRYLCTEIPTGKRGSQENTPGRSTLTKTISLIYHRMKTTIFAAKVYSKASGVISCWFMSHTPKQTGKMPESSISLPTFQWIQIMCCFIIIAFFQIEFLYRDGKQHTGLGDSQARSENKLTSSSMLL